MAAIGTDDQGKEASSTAYKLIRIVKLANVTGLKALSQKSLNEQESPLFIS